MTDSFDLTNVLMRLRPDIPEQFNELTAIEKQWHRLLAVFSGCNPPPYEVLVHPSSRCNLRCSWCIGEHVPMIPNRNRVVPISSKLGPERLPDTLSDPISMLRLMKGICEFKTTEDYILNGKKVCEPFEVQAISFSGLIGEPLIAREAVLQAVQYLHTNAKRIGLFTNGIYIDDEVAETLQMADYVLVSIDAASPLTYQQLKFPSSSKKGIENFYSAIKGIERLTKGRGAASHLAVNASFIVCAGNYHELYKAANLAKSLGVDTFRVKQDNSANHRLSEIEIASAKEQLERVEADLVCGSFNLVRIHRKMAFDEVVRHFSKCEITNLVASVGSDGHLYPCNYHPRPGGMSYGSAIDSSFADIWNSESRMRQRNELPSRCPPTCDPFKGRANHLLQPIRAAFQQNGGQGATEVLSTLLSSSATKSEKLFR